MGVGAESFKLLIMAWSFWWPSPISKLHRDSQSPHISLACKKTLITLEIPRALEVILSGTEFKRPNVRTKDAFSTPVTQEMTRILGDSVLGTGGRTTVYISYYFTHTFLFQYRIINTLLLRSHTRDVERWQHFLQVDLRGNTINTITRIILF